MQQLGLYVGNVHCGYAEVSFSYSMAAAAMACTHTHRSAMSGPAALHIV
jgi:hypothetical protein